MRTRILSVLLAGAALLGSVAVADAKVLALRVRSGGTAVTTSTTFSTPSGIVNNSGTVNSINYTATGVSTEGLNSIGLDLTTVGTNTTNSVRTITYFLTVTGLSNQPNIQGWQDLFSGLNPTVGSNTVSSAVLRVYYDPGNHLFNTNTLIYDSGFPAGCGFPPAYSCSGSGSFTTPATPFSLTQILTVSYKVGSQGLPVSANSSFSAVPEPTSLAILGSGLLLAGWMFRRRRSDKAA